MFVLCTPYSGSGESAIADLKKEHRHEEVIRNTSDQT